MKKEVEVNEICCVNCKKKFTWLITHQNYPGGKDREPIDCPYCGADNGSVITSGLVVTRKIEEE